MLSELAKEMFAKLELPYPAVAMKYSFDEPEGYEQCEKTMALCSFVKEAQSGRKFYITIDNEDCMGKMMLGLLKSLFTTSFATKMSYLLVKKHLGQVKKDFDPAEHGGAPILGITKPVIKAHGSSNARAFRSAIHQAVNYAASGVMADIEKDSLKLHEKKKAEKAEKRAEGAESAE